MTENIPENPLDIPVIETGLEPVGPKPIIDFADFLYNEHRIALLKRWSDLQRAHMSFGCPLDNLEPGTTTVCVIHGTPADPREFTQEEFLGSFANELPKV